MNEFSPEICFIGYSLTITTIAISFASCFFRFSFLFCLLNFPPSVSTLSFVPFSSLFSSALEPFSSKSSFSFPTFSLLVPPSSDTNRFSFSRFRPSWPDFSTLLYSGLLFPSAWVFPFSFSLFTVFGWPSCFFFFPFLSSSLTHSRTAFFRSRIVL